MVKNEKTKSSVDVGCGNSLELLKFSQECDLLIAATSYFYKTHKKCANIYDYKTREIICDEKFDSPETVLWKHVSLAPSREKNQSKKHLLVCVFNDKSPMQFRVRFETP
jgi:hypothetical protein